MAWQDSQVLDKEAWRAPCDSVPEVPNPRNSALAGTCGRKRDGNCTWLYVETNNMEAIDFQQAKKPDLAL